MTLASQKYLTALDMGPLYQKLIQKLEKWYSDINSFLCGDDSLCFKDEDIFRQENRQFWKDIVVKEVVGRFLQETVKIFF